MADVLAASAKADPTANPRPGMGLWLWPKNIENPHFIGVVFDVSAPTFRHEMFPEYKAHREEMPEDLRKSIPYYNELISLIPFFLRL